MEGVFLIETCVDSIQGLVSFSLLWCVECFLIPSSSFSVILWCRNTDGIGVSSRHQLDFIPPHFLILCETDLTSTSTATSTTIHLSLWRTITKLIVCHSPLSLHKVLTFVPSAFTITMYEFETTIATLWGHTMGAFHVHLL